MSPLNPITNQKLVYSHTNHIIISYMKWRGRKVTTEYSANNIQGTVISVEYITHDRERPEGACRLCQIRYKGQSQAWNIHKGSVK
jgi:hypothetical protein